MATPTSPEEPVSPGTTSVPLPRHQSDHAPHGESKEMGLPTLEKASSTSNLPSSSQKRKVSVIDSNEEKHGIPRRSTQFSRKASMRQSAEFDRRVDGPFGRPSVTMVRRASQQASIYAQDSPLPVAEQPTATSPGALEQNSDSDAGATAGAPPVLALSFEPEPPPLDYDVWSRKWWIVGFWALVIFDTVVCPVALYFGLWIGLYLNGRMSANTVFSIVTAAVGGMSIFEYFLRLWKLVNKKSTCRVIGSKWWHGDFFHWNFTIGWLIIMIELIVGTVQEHPPARLIAMCVPTMLYVFAIEMLIMDTLRYFEHPAPIRISSIPKGAQVRPGIYSIIEDVIAVDGSGGTVYREALNKRYEASHVFRAMLRRLGLFWSIGSAAMATVCTILIFTIPEYPAYAIGWTAPFIWAGIWALMTYYYVKVKLKEEKTAWAEELAEKSAAAVV